MENIKYSEEQENIFEYVTKGLLNVSVQAVAGAGKTTTLVECVRRLPEDKKILVVAHNRLTKETLCKKLDGVKNVNIFTIHGLSWRMYTEHFGVEPKIVDDKYRIYVNKNLDEIAGEEYEALSQSKKLIYKTHVFDLIDKARYNLKQSAKEIKKLATKKYGMSLLSNEPETVASILKWGSENISTVDYQDMLTLPYELGYNTKRYLSDYIFLDEAQDTSLSQQYIISRCLKRNTRFIYFGDRDQSINNWCGSDTEAFDHLKDKDTFGREAQEFPLTTNYRCGTEIIKFAKQYTDNNIHAREGAQSGVVNFDVKLNTAKNGDMILCRNIAPLMDVYRIGVSLGKKMYFRGTELGQALKLSVDATSGEKIEDIIKSLKKRLIATWDHLTESTELTPEETMLNPSIISILDTIKTLECLPKTVTDRTELENFINDVFSEEEKDGIELSTIHRAKGLEADNVFIICPSLIPSKLAKLPWQVEEEKHLQYVMCTRPKNTLNFVSENDVKPSSAFLGNNQIHSELKKIRSEIENV